MWLDPERTSPFRFYQYWINVEDADVVRYLKFFSLLDARRDRRTGAQAVEDRTASHEPLRRSLAEDVTRTASR